MTGSAGSMRPAEDLLEVADTETAIKDAQIALAVIAMKACPDGKSAHVEVEVPTRPANELSLGFDACRRAHQGAPFQFSGHEQGLTTLQASGPV